MVRFVGLDDLGVVPPGRARTTGNLGGSCRARLPALLALVLLVAACGGSGQTSGSSDAAPVSAAPAGDPPESANAASGENPHLAADICTLVPVVGVAAASGGLEPFETEASATPPTSCRYLFDVPEGTGTRSASVTVQMLGDYGLERIGVGDSAVDVTGLGDEAWAHDLTDTRVLYVREGDLVFSVAAAGGGDWEEATRAVGQLVLDLL